MHDCGPSHVHFQPKSLRLQTHWVELINFIFAFAWGVDPCLIFSLGLFSSDSCFMACMCSGRMAKVICKHVSPGIAYHAFRVSSYYMLSTTYSHHTPRDGPPYPTVPQLSLVYNHCFFARQYWACSGLGLLLGPSE